MNEIAAGARRPRMIDLLIALGLHVMALPIWVIQALLCPFVLLLLSRGVRRAVVPPRPN